MPVAFLTDEQARRYGRYTGEPTAAPLARFFSLDDADRALITRRREDHLRLGFALQLGTVRFLGTFLTDPTDVPPGVVTHLSRQLRIADPSCLPRDLDRPVTHYEHAQDIQRRDGYRDFHDPQEVFRLIRWLYTRAWLSAERPSVLFDLATARLVERKVLLPGVTVLERLVASIRDRAATRLWQRLAQLPNADQQAKLEALVQVPDGARSSPLDRLRRAPTRVSGPALVAALQRLEHIRGIGVSALAVDHLPPNRLRDLARYGAAARAQAIARMAPERRLATLLAFARAFEVIAMDDALDLLDLLMTDIIHEAQTAGQHARLRTLRDLDTAALHLWGAIQVLLDEQIDEAAVRRQAFAQIPRQQLVEAGAQVETLARPPDDHYYPELVDRYRRVRLFLPPLLRTVAFDGTQAGQPMLTALAFLRQLEHRRPPDMRRAPLDLVPSAWRRLVLPRHQPVADRRAYTLCLMERLQDSLRRRDVFVRRSERWGDPRVRLLQGPQWDTLRPQVCRALGRNESPAPELHALGSGPLDLALTAPTFADRILGKQISREAPMQVVFFASGNNMVFQGDMARRVVPIDLYPQMEHPEERDNFTHSPLLPWVLRERPSLVVAALTILRAYFVAACPRQGISALGSFEEWSTLVRQALIWAGEADPCESRKDLEAESDADHEALSTILAAWYACYGTQAKTLRQVAQDIQRHGETAWLAHAWEELRDALGSLDPHDPGKGFNARLVGEALRGWKGRLIGDKRFVRAGMDRNKSVQWQIEVVSG